MQSVMRFRSAIFGLLVSVAVLQSAPTHAQARIGYADPDRLTMQMPETEDMQQRLQIYEMQLQKPVASKEIFLQTKLAEYRQKVSALTATQRTELEKTIQELQRGLQELVSESEQKLALKQQELVMPIVTKLNDAIAKVAKEKRLEIVLRKEAILYFEKTKVIDITLDVVKALGITITQASQ